MINEHENILDLWFPVQAALSPEDKFFLLKTLSLIKSKKDKFNYLEIGSWLGGSLAAFIREPSCVFALSIDDRGKVQPDERGANYDYRSDTTDMMLANLRNAGLNTSKLKIFDGSIESMPAPDVSFDLAFIDGEHTDVATFRDFMWVMPLMSESSVVLFHDSSVIYKSLEIITEYLRAKKINFLMRKEKISEVTALFFGSYTNIEFGSYYAEAADWSEFKVAAELFIIKNLISNRVKLNTSLEIGPPPTR
jgi:hypothetical protein